MKKTFSVSLILFAVFAVSVLQAEPIVSYDYSSTSGADPVNQGWQLETGGTTSLPAWLDGYDTSVTWPYLTANHGWRVVDVVNDDYCYYKVDLTSQQAIQLTSSSWTLYWTFSMDSTAWSNNGSTSSTNFFLPPNQSRQGYNGICIGTTEFLYYIIATADSSGNLAIWDRNGGSSTVSPTHVLTSGGGNNGYNTQYTLTITYNGTDAVLSYNGSDYTLYKMTADGSNRVAFGALSGINYGSVVYNEVAIETVDNSWTPGASGYSVVEAIDEDLDMAKQVQSHESVVISETGPALVEYGPRMVVGEGDSTNNYTIVKVLNKYQICELQFTAYPTSVRGGVNVSAGALFSNDAAIVTCPISDVSTREIRIFSQSGKLLCSFEPADLITEPFVITVGDFVLDNDYEEIAVASKNQSDINRDILIYNGQGQLLDAVSEPLPYVDTDDVLVLSTDHGRASDGLIAYYQIEKKAIKIDIANDALVQYNLNTLPDESSVYESAFEDQLFAAGAPEPMLSTLYAVDKQGLVSSTDAGTRENRFWVQAYGEVANWEDSEYVKHGKYRHIRPDYQSDNYWPSPDFSKDAYTDWAGIRINNYVNSEFSTYHTEPASLWEPTFSHRHSPTVAGGWYNVIDPETGLHRYRMLDRNNQPFLCEGGAFYAFTYAIGIPEIDHLYLWPQRAFLRELAYHLRGPDGNAEQMIGVEPNHEFEVPNAPGGSIGDYNPKMIAGFYNHLKKYYSTVSRINSRFGTSFTGADDFDAPRGQERGDWDAYDTANDFYNAWVEYNRKIIFLRIAQGFREALIAGIPPEAIKTHQIPQGYALGQPIVDRRITPIDWIFTAGTSYGSTRYNIWYTKQYNWLQGAFSSGQTMVSAGEYDAVTSNQASANAQISYMFNNGVNFVHHMKLFASMDEVNRDSFISLLDDGPRPGTTGGIGQIRAVSQPTANGSKSYNIACIGTGENRNGLLKSINAYGNWEGTVYVTPFHAAINVIPIGTEERDFHLTTSDMTLGPVTDLMAGDQIEVSFKARTDDSTGYMTLLVLHAGTEMFSKRRQIPVSSEWGYYRYTLRFQSVMDSIYIMTNSGIRDTATGHKQDIEIEDFSMLVHREQVTRKRYGIYSGTPHAGGVTFDVLSTDFTCGLDPVKGDLNSDCQVDLLDLAILAENWLM